MGGRPDGIRHTTDRGELAATGTAVDDGTLTIAESGTHGTPFVVSTRVETAITAGAVAGEFAGRVGAVDEDPAALDPGSGPVAARLAAAPSSHPASGRSAPRRTRATGIHATRLRLTPHAPPRSRSP